MAGGANIFFLASVAALLLVAAPARGRAAATDAVLTTFDPYGAADAPAVTEGAALEELRSKLFLSAAYAFTSRTGFAGTDAREENHVWTFGATYAPWRFLFVGVSAPVIRARFIVPAPANSSQPAAYESLSGEGFGDLATFVGTELPRFPLTVTAMLMWPTGDRDKGLGTGEFSGGLLADLRLSFGIVDTRIGGFYILVDDPDDVSLPNTYGASVGVGVRATKWLHVGAGAGWSYATLITTDSVHLFDVSARAMFTIVEWLSAVVGFGFEYFPVKAYTPSAALVFAI